MREHGLGNIDNAIIRKFTFLESKNGVKSNGSALKNSVLNYLAENDIEYIHLKGNTYEIVSKTGERYLAVIACYSESRKQKSSYTVGKETADILKQKHGYANWYCLLATISETGEVVDIRVCKDDALQLSEHPRSSGIGVYHAIAKNIVDAYDLTFDKWYDTLHD